MPLSVAVHDENVGNWLFCCLASILQALSIFKFAKTANDDALVDIPVNNSAVLEYFANS